MYELVCVVDMCTGRFVSWVLYGWFVTLICVRMGLCGGYVYGWVCVVDMCTDGFAPWIFVRVDWSPRYCIYGLEGWLGLCNVRAFLYFCYNYACTFFAFVSCQVFMS